MQTLFSPLLEVESLLCDLLKSKPGCNNHKRNQYYYTHSHNYTHEVERGDCTDKQPVGCCTEVSCSYSGACVQTSWLLYRGVLLIQWSLCTNQLAAVQRCPAHTVEPVYKPVGCCTEVSCSYSGTCIQTSWLLYRGALLIKWNLCTNQLAAVQRCPAHRVE